MSGFSSRVLQRVLGRVSKIVRARSAALRRRVRPVADAVRHAPVPPTLRRTLYRYVPWQPWTRNLPTDRLLLGGQNGLSARQFADASGLLLWPSIRVSDGPHVRLLRDSSGRSPADAEILSSDYADMARTVIRTTGNFFSARDDQGVVEVARRFLAEHQGIESPAGDPLGRSVSGSAVRVAKIRHSDFLQVIDGHHRVSSLIAAGEQTVTARVGWLGTSTPLQDVLDQMSWIGGQRELYQPLEAPELEHAWVVVRKCTDRLAKMQDFLSGLPDLPASPSYLDVASCYGWFVAMMRDAGYDAYGVERDPLGPVIGEAAYGLPRDRVTTADAELFLADTQRRWDVVSCLSLVHHFALGRASMDADSFLRLLDSRTGRVLFLDTGQSHEEWLRRRLPGWHTPDIIERLQRETTFESVIDLGPDEDAVGAYAHNYGRHLFACVRSTV